jgi:hypothetical protein
MLSYEHRGKKPTQKGGFLANRLDSIRYVVQQTSGWYRICLESVLGRNNASTKDSGVV